MANIFVLKKRVFERAFLTVLLGVLLLTGLISCGVGGQSASPDGGVSGGETSITFIWPDGYSLNESTKEIVAPSSQLSSYTPAYLLKVNIKIIDSAGRVWYDVDLLPPDFTMSFTLDPGAYTFYATAYTSLETTFTGQTTRTFQAGETPHITIPLTLNVVPVIISVDAPGSVYKGEVADITVHVEDEDDNETLSITKNASDGAFLRSVASGASNKSFAYNLKTFFDPQFSWIAPSALGPQTIIITVDDGHGGVVVKVITIDVLNREPTVKISVDKSLVTVGDSLLFTCTGSDADAMDSGALALAFSNPPGGSGTGGTITSSHTTTSADGTSLTASCTATDGSGATATDYVTVSISQSLIIISDVTSNCTEADEWEFPVISGASYTITCTPLTSGQDIAILRRIFSGGSWANDGAWVDLNGANGSETMTWTASYTGNYRFRIWETNDNGYTQYSCTFTSTIPPSYLQTEDEFPWGCG